MEAALPEEIDQVLPTLTRGRAWVEAALISGKALVEAVLNGRTTQGKLAHMGQRPRWIL